jgi:hypothetical protein
VSTIFESQVVRDTGKVIADELNSPRAARIAATAMGVLDRRRLETVVVLTWRGSHDCCSDG